MAKFNLNIESHFPQISIITKEELRENLIKMIRKVYTKSRYIDVESAHQYEPARKLISYPLSKHIRDVTDCAILLAKRYGIVDMNILVAGCILHDLDKYIRYGHDKDGNIFEDTSIRHAVYGAAMLQEEGFCNEITHMVMSHSRSCSPVQPSSMEAIILRHSDELVVELEYKKNNLDIWSLGDGDSGLHCLSR